MGFLEIRKLTKFFGGLKAVSELDATVANGEMLGLIGPNGAGKSTLLGMIDGSLRISRGDIVFDGTTITRLAPHRRAELGIARVFQHNVLFKSFSVADNVRVGCHLQSRITPLNILFNTKSLEKQEMELEQRITDTLNFVGLKRYSKESAVNLSHGMQRVLALAIALVTRPKLLLLDEPFAGMNAGEIETMMGLIRSVRERLGVTCVLIEHNLKAVMGLCDRVVVLSFGKKIAEGTPGQVVTHPEVLEAYLGREEDDVA